MLRNPKAVELVPWTNKEARSFALHASCLPVLWPNDPKEARSANRSIPFACAVHEGGA